MLSLLKVKTVTLLRVLYCVIHIVNVAVVVVVS